MGADIACMIFTQEFLDCPLFSNLDVSAVKSRNAICCLFLDCYGMKYKSKGGTEITYLQSDH